jgi:hypothetical protein
VTSQTRGKVGIAIESSTSTRSQPPGQAVGGAPPRLNILSPPTRRLEAQPDHVPRLPGRLVTLSDRLPLGCHFGSASRALGVAARSGTRGNDGKALAQPFRAVTSSRFVASPTLERPWTHGHNRKALVTPTSYVGRWHFPWNSRFPQSRPLLSFDMRTSPGPPVRRLPGNAWVTGLKIPVSGVQFSPCPPFFGPPNAGIPRWARRSVPLWVKLLYELLLQFRLRLQAGTQDLCPTVISANARHLVATAEPRRSEANVSHR